MPPTQQSQDNHGDEHRATVARLGNLLSSNGCNLPEQTACFIIDPGGEVEIVLIAPKSTITECESPQSCVLNRIAVRILQGSKESARRWIERIDRSVAEIPNQQTVAERSEIIGRERDSPRGIQYTTGNESSHEIPIQVKLTHDPVAGSGQLFPGRRINDRIHDVQQSSDALYNEG